MYFLDYRFFAFIPAAVALYWIAGRTWRNYVLLAANIAWLALFSPSTLVAVAVLTVAVVFPIARLAARARERAPARALHFAWGGTISLLAITTVLRLKSWFFPDLTLSSSPLSNELLHWIGFSYFLLKSVHVMFASARGITTPTSVVTLVQYMLFVPTLSAGPLYRLDVFEQQLAEVKRASWDAIHDGLVRVVIGLAKKVIAVPILSGWAVSLHDNGLVWQPVAFVTTYVMLFLDFSGYSDIAIGIGRMLGFTVPENFKQPFTATTLTQFWRNWHATLGDWLRENIFIPLGGVRATGWKLSAIVLFSMFVVGVWHGYHWIFLAWGIYHGVMLLLENRIGLKPLRPHGTPVWQLAIRYTIIQAIIIVGMFAFIHGLDM